MKKNILVQTGTRTEQQTVISYDEEGNPIEEVINVEVPVMESQYVDMTPDEIAELPQEETQEEPTQEDRIEAQVMYTALMTDTLLEEI